MSVARADVLGVFPHIDSIGGVEASGREAWRSIVNLVGCEHAHFFSTGPRTSKSRAVLNALRTDCHSEIVLVWHLHLLKLVPFLNKSPTCLIVFLHGIEAWKRQDFVTSWVLRTVRLFLVNSNHTWRRFIALNPDFQNAAHHVVHLGAGDPIEGATPEPCQLPIALMIGRMQRGEDYKGHRQMIEAWPRLVRHLPNAKLWIVGDGDLRPDLERLALERGLGGQVRFWGPVSDAEKEQLLAQSRCLALPSRGEGFGLVYLEAMRLGRPCLVSNLDAGREVVNPPEAGIEVDPDNLGEVAEATLRLLTSGPEWNQSSSLARRRYEERFTAEHFHQRLQSVLFQGLDLP